MQARDQPSALPLQSVVIDLTRLGTMCWRDAALVEYFRKQGNRHLGSGLCSLTFFCSAGDSPSLISCVISTHVKSFWTIHNSIAINTIASIVVWDQLFALQFGFLLKINNIDVWFPKCKQYCTILIPVWSFENTVAVHYQKKPFMFWDDTRMGNYQQQFDTIMFLLPVFWMENRNVLTKLQRQG